MRLKSVILVFVILLSASLVFAQQPSNPDRAESDLLNTKIRELVRVMNSERVLDQVLEQMFTAYEAMIPDVPREIWINFRNEIKTSDYVEMIVPIYAKHFTGDDIEGLIQFYNSSLGKKIVEKQAIIAQESMAAGMNYGQTVAKKIIAELIEKGYKVPASLRI